MSKVTEIAQRMGMKEREIAGVNRERGGLVVTTFEGAQTFLPAKGAPVPLDEHGDVPPRDTTAVFAEATHAEEHLHPAGAESEELLRLRDEAAELRAKLAELESAAAGESGTAEAAAAAEAKADEDAKAAADAQAAAAADAEEHVTEPVPPAVGERVTEPAVPKAPRGRKSAG